MKVGWLFRSIFLKYATIGVYEYEKNKAKKRDGSRAQARSVRDASTTTSGKAQKNQRPLQICKSGYEVVVWRGNGVSQHPEPWCAFAGLFLW